MRVNLRKSKTSYTVMIVSDNADKSPKTYHIKAGLAGFTGILIFMLFTALICFVVYNSIIAARAVNRVQSQQEKIEQLEDSYTQLQARGEQLEEAYAQAVLEKEDLAKEIAEINETINAEKEEVQLAENAKHIPSKFPLDAAAAMKEDTDGRAAGMTPKEERREIVFTAAVGTNVVATASGKVISIASDAEDGSLISIDHGNGYISMYRNNSEPVVKESGEVDAGTVLFVIGNSNPDVGYSIRKKDVYIDPWDMLDIKG